MKTIVIFISLASMIFASCSVPLRIKREFRYCFDGEKTGLDTLINIKGYYAPPFGRGSTSFELCLKSIWGCFFTSLWFSGYKQCFID